jgi:putrescine transport system substrate-binding protein
MKEFFPWNSVTLTTVFSVLLCITPAWAANAQDAKILNIYNWSDYIADDTIANFEKESGIKVHYDTYDANEILHAKLVAGSSGYDIVVPSSQWGKMQAAAGLLKTLDKSRLPNYKNLDPSIMTQLAKVDPGNAHLVPWLWGYTTVGINVAQVKKALGATPLPADAWDLLLKPEYAGKLKSCGISMLDSGDEVFPAVLRHLGKAPFSASTADYEAAFKVLKAVRPFVRTFSSSGYINDLAAGSLCVVLGWSGDIGIAKQRAIEAKNGQEIEVLVPKSGAVLMFDTMAIPADAKHVDAAYQWINYILRPEVHASLTNKVFYANPNAAATAKVKAEIAKDRSIYLSKDDLGKMVPPDSVSQEVRRVRTRLYTRFKNNL